MSENPERAKIINNLLIISDDCEKAEIESTTVAHINAALKMLEKSVLAFKEAETCDAEERLIVCSKTNKVKGYCLVVSINNKTANG